MITHKRCIPLLGVVLVCILVAQTVATAQQASNNSASKQAKIAKHPVHEIELPEYEPELPAGPNKEVFDRQCILCHSGRYVTMQPQFSQAVWEKEVKKMVDAYGASIMATEQQQIVEYLVAIKGPAAGK